MWADPHKSRTSVLVQVSMSSIFKFYTIPVSREIVKTFTLPEYFPPRPECLEELRQFLAESGL